jgi:hypothetical protein
MGAPLNGRPVGLDKFSMVKVLVGQEAQNASGGLIEDKNRARLVDDNDAVAHTLNDCVEPIASHPFRVRMAYPRR